MLMNTGNVSTNSKNLLFTHIILWFMQIFLRQQQKETDCLG